MKKCVAMCGVVLLAAFAVALISSVDCFAGSGRYQQNLTDNPKLDEANKLYKKAVEQIEDGDGVGDPQRAVPHYAAAESYLRRAVFALKELGNKYAIDVTKETEFCDKLQRETHSSQGLAKRTSS